MKKLILTGIMLLMVLGVSGCRNNNDEANSIKVGYFNNVTHAQALLMKSEKSLENTFGKDINVKWTAFNAGPAEVEALFAGDIDIGYIGPVPAISANVKSNGDVQILSGAALERIRFMTSHPKDLSEELIEVMKNSKKICNHLHLPLQSGSSRILKIMNRHYDKEHYLELVDKIRAAVPDIALTTDIIVGFPGETEEDFEETMDVVRRVRYDSAFTFIYSKRTGTPAATMDDQIQEEVIKERFDRLLHEVQTISAEKAGKLTGQTLPVLVEEVNGQDASLVTGKLTNNSTVHFPGTADMIGTIQNVVLEECKGFYYIGRLA